MSAPPPPMTGVAPRRRPDVLQRQDGLTKGQLRAVIAAIAALHVGGGWALLQIPSVREAVVEAAPIFVNFVAAPEPPKPEAPPPPPPPPPKPQLRPPAPAPVVAAPPSPAPAPFTVPPPPPEPVVEPTPPAPPEPSPAPPAPPPPARNLPPEAAQYISKPVLEWPRRSKQMGESGIVTLRVYVDETGRPRDIIVAKSSGFPRLDQAAVEAMRRARFHPWKEDGRAVAGWQTGTFEF